MTKFEDSLLFTMPLLVHSKINVCVAPGERNSIHVYNDSVIHPASYRSSFGILYVQKGRVDAKINQQRLILSSGDLILTAPGSFVFLVSKGELSGISAFLHDRLPVWPPLPDVGRYDRNLIEKSFFDFYLLNKSRNHTELKNYFDQLIGSAPQVNCEQAIEEIERLLRKDIGYFVDRLHLINRKRLSTQLSILKRVEDIRNDIDENCMHKFDLGLISKKWMMSKFALIRNFKEVYRITPHQYYIQRKTCLAKEFLAHQLTLKEVADRCGYPDIYSFSKQFKSVEGFAPSNYRQNIGHQRVRSKPCI